MSRIDDAPVLDLHDLAGQVADALCDTVAADGVPFAFYGQCLGAVLAYEVTALLETRAAPQPFRLVAAGSNAPQAGPPQVDDPADFLRRMGSPEELFGFPELLDLTVQTLLRDVSLLGGYTCSGRVLDTPISVLYGNADELIDPASVEEWRGLSSAPVVVREIEGGHFLEEYYPTLLDGLRSELVDAR